MLRSINMAQKIIKAEDNDTAVTCNAIRNWCKEGKIKCVIAGNRIYVDIDSLKKFVG